jgi:hypothetical protein
MCDDMARSSNSFASVMASAYQIGKTYRTWLASDPGASNASVRSALQDFVVGSGVSLALICDIAISRQLRSINISENQRLTVDKYKLIINELKGTYNTERIYEAVRFLEGFSGFTEGDLQHTLQKEIKEPSRVTESGGSRKRVTTSRELCVEGALITINALGRIETYILYIIFLGAIDYIAAWNLTINPGAVAVSWGLIGIYSNLSIWYCGGLILTFNHLSGSGRSIQELGTQELLSRCWRSYKASFVASLYIFGGLLLLIVPGIILGLRYMFVEQISVLEGGSINSCLEKSKQLAPNVRWSVVKASALSFLAIMIFQIAIGLVIGKEATKTFAFNLELAGAGSLCLTWITGIVYIGYRKALSHQATH